MPKFWKSVSFLSLMLGLFLPFQFSFAFSDVDEAVEYAEAIDSLAQEGVVHGYSNGDFQPRYSINRAEFMKILVRSRLGHEPVEFGNKSCFSDVPSGEWFTSDICWALAQGIISGYPSGEFKPAQEINVAEAAKIVVNTFGVKQADSVGTEWFHPFTDSLAENHYIPPSAFRASNSLTRGEMAELIYRVKHKIHNRDSLPKDLFRVDWQEQKACNIGFYPEAPFQEALQGSFYEAVSRCVLPGGKKLYMAPGFLNDLGEYRQAALLTNARDGVLDYVFLSFSDSDRETLPPFSSLFLSDEAVYALFMMGDGDLWSHDLYRLTFSHSEVATEFLGKSLHENSGDPEAFYEIREDGVYYVTRPDDEPYSEEQVPSADKNSFQDLNCSYGKDRSAIYFQGDILPDADFDTFEVANCLFARDKNRIYFENSSFEASDPATFHVLNKAYFIDKDQVYYVSEPIQSADVGTFEVFEFMPWGFYNESFFKPAYAKDKNHVYFYGGILEGADPVTFKILEGAQYTQDAQFVYYEGEVLAGADPSTFELITSSMAKDGSKIYSFGNLIEGPEALTFEAIDEKYYRDKFFVYSETSVIRGLDSATFERVSPSSRLSHIDYVKDANGVYLLIETEVSLEIEKLEDADPNTIEVFDHDFRFVKTSSFVYFYGKKLPGVDPASFELIHFQYFAKDKNAVYGMPLLSASNDAFVTLEGVDPSVFEILIYDFGRDKNKLFGRGLPVDVEGIDIATVQPLSHSSFKDKNRVYCKSDGGQWQVLDGLDPSNAKEHPAPSC